MSAKPKSLVRRVLNRVLHHVARLAPGATSLRPALHRLRGMKVGVGVWIGDDAYLDGEYPECIEIHDHAGVSMRVTLVAHTKGPGRIVLERHSFVGVGTIISCPGGREVRIGEGAVIGPGCVITRSVPPRAFVVASRPEHVANVRIFYTEAKDNDEFVEGLDPLVARRQRAPE